MGQVTLKGQDVTSESVFVPKGALVFFILVLTTMATIWLIVYFIMIRQA